MAAPGNLVYSASKAVGRYLCQSTNAELKIDGQKDDIDVLCMYPSFVKTQMISHLATPVNAITVESCVKSGLRDLGQEEETYGALIHEVSGTLVRFIDKYMGDLQSRVQRFFVKKGARTVKSRAG